MSQYDQLLLASAQRYGVDPDIARQVMRVESGGNPNAVSPAGAIGLMQLMPGTAQELGVDPYDPAQNIDGGMRYLSQQIKKYGPQGGLAAYNAGPGRYERSGGDLSKLPRETQQYVSKVTGMNTALPSARAAYDRHDPASVYDFLLQNQQDVPVQQLTPEQRAALTESRQRQAAMLPLAIGAALSGDKSIRALGSQMYNNSVGAQGAQKLGDYGWMTEGGDLIENPLRASDRQESRRDRALALAVQAAKQQQAPAGYTWVDGPNGEPSLTFIPGGPGDPKVKLTTGQPSEDERKSAGYALRIQKGLNTIQDVTGKNPDVAKPELTARALSKLPVFGQDLGNWATSQDRQRVEAAQLDMLDAALTLNTGAAYTREQLQGLSKSYFPQIGDGEKTIAEKKARLDDLIATARTRAGRADTGPAAPAAPAAPAGGMPSADAIAAELARRGVK
jgi:hypothetical protein